MNHRDRDALLGLVATVTLLTAIPFETRALADGFSPSAQGSAERGRARYAAGDFAGAILAFRAAYRASPSSGLLFDLAQAYRRSGDCTLAAQMYEGYLAAPSSPALAAVATRQALAMQRCAQPDVEPEPVASESPAAASIATAAQPNRRRQVGIGLVIAGGVGLVASTYFAIRASNDAGTVQTAYEHGGVWHDLAAVDARGARDAHYAQAIGIASGVAVVTGIALYAIGARRTVETSTALMATSHGVEASWSHAF